MALGHGVNGAQREHRHLGRGVALLARLLLLLLPLPLQRPAHQPAKVLAAERPSIERLRGCLAEVGEAAMQGRDLLAVRAQQVRRARAERHDNDHQRRQQPIAQVAAAAHRQRQSHRQMNVSSCPRRNGHVDGAAVSRCAIIAEADRARELARGGGDITGI